MKNGNISECSAIFCFLSPATTPLAPDAWLLRRSGYFERGPNGGENSTNYNTRHSLGISRLEISYRLAGQQLRLIAVDDSNKIVDHINTFILSTDR